MTVVILNPDTFRPLDFNMTADQACAARADFRLASELLLYAQKARMEAIRGEMTNDKRAKLLEAHSVALDHPRGVS